MKSENEMQKDMCKNLENTEQSFEEQSIKMVGYTPKHCEATIEELKRITETHFPGIWSVTEACMAVIANLFLKEQSGCIGLNLMGPPSSQKTTVLSLFYGLATTDPILTYKTDNFTCKSFVSHAANIAKQDLTKIDLLPRIKNKCVLVPELAPIFGKRKEDLVENTSILIRVFDGEGYESDSGVKGKRGYSGDYFFTWLGATVPPSYAVWKTMNHLGARWFFNNVPSFNYNTEELAELVNGKLTYSEKLEICRPFVLGFFKKLISKYGELRTVEWDNSKDNRKAVLKIMELAKLLAKLRGTVITWKTDNGELLHQPPLIEEPMRASHLLLQLARGRALLYGKTNITLEDVPMVRRIVLSSCQPDRSKLINLLVSQKGKIDCRLLAKAFNFSERYARTRMEIFAILGLGKYKEFNTDNGYVGRPHSVLKLNKEYMDILEVKQTVCNNTNTLHTVNSSSEIKKDVINSD